MNDVFQEIMSRLSENARIALQRADFYSKRYDSGYVNTEHLLLGIVRHDTSSGATILRHAGIDDVSVLEKALGREGVDFEVDGAMAMMSLSEALVLTLRVAANIADEFDSPVIGTEHILLSLLTQPNSSATLLLKKAKINVIELRDEIQGFLEHTAMQTARQARQRNQKNDGMRILRRYGRDLTAAATAGELDNVIGRHEEIERVVTVLSRRTKSNPVLIGDAGVGKTAIAEGLAQRIVAAEVPDNLQGKRIVQIDISAMVAGTKFRGDFEERIKGLINEVSEHPEIILFFDEMHLLSGAGSSSDGNMDAANILKPALARGEIRIIGATTLDEYRKYIEKDKALARRFQTVLVSEPNASVTKKIITGIKKHYEKHHSVKISEAIIETAINMAERYISDRAMPDKVIDVIDEASAIAHVSIDTQNYEEYKKLNTQLKKERNTLDRAASDNYELTARIKTNIARIEARLAELKSLGADKKVKPTLSEEHLAKAISLKTGIPVAKVYGSEKELLINIESHLRKAIVGQDEAIEKVAKAIRRGRSGVANPHRPIGSFLFMGPTGVGKTELARVIAREVFGGDNALIKIDMSEFGEKHNVSRLVGAPAGYVGYDDGGKLTEAVRRRPYSVILFDEIEKAHPEVFNILLQILEDGVLTDGQGNRVRFNNAIIILTSNLGSKEMYKESELGFSAQTAADKKELAAEAEANKAFALKSLKKHMRPELINRLDAILVFHALLRKDVEKIFDNLLADLRRRLAQQKLGLVIDEAARAELIARGFDPKNGARPLRRALEDEVESAVSELIIKDVLQNGDIIAVSYQDGQFTYRPLTETPVTVTLPTAKK